MITVLEVLSSWPPETFLARHIKALNDFGDKIELQFCVLEKQDSAGSLAASIFEGELDDFSAQEIPHFRNKSHWEKLVLILRNGGFKKYLDSPINFRKEVILDFFIQFDVDLIHFHNANLAVNLSWVTEAIGIPYSLSLRGTDVQVYTLRDRASFDSVQSVIKNAAGIHSVCCYLGEKFAQSKHTTIYSPLPFMPYKKRRREKVDDKTNYSLVSAGRFQWQKGYTDLLIALRGLISKGINANLTLIGSGTERDRIHQKVLELELEDNVSFTGKLNFVELVSLLEEADAYVQSSISEGLSNSLLEAIMLRCPVFATDVGGTGEIIIDKETGFLLTPMRPDLWVSKLKQLEDSRKLEVMANNAFNSLQERFYPQTHAEGFRSFFNQSVSFKSNDTDGVMRIEGLSLDGRDLTLISSDATQYNLRIYGKWEWRSGIDTIIRGLYRYLHPKDFCIELIGYGPMEEELKYTLWKMEWGKVEVAFDEDFDDFVGIELHKDCEKPNFVLVLNETGDYCNLLCPEERVQKIIRHRYSEIGKIILGLI